jgi:hypothetical protein
VAASGQEVGEQPDRLGIALDGALALVLRTEVRWKLPFRARRFSALAACATTRSCPLIERCARLGGLLGLVLKGAMWVLPATIR